jgi:dTDP-glucose 4,6-dehydratase
VSDLRREPPSCVLVTGGAGFVGSALVRELRTRWPSARIAVLDLLTYAGRRENLEGVVAPEDLEVADVADGPAVHAALDRLAPELVFHLAAETHVDRSIDDPAPFFRTNAMGTLVLFEALRGLAARGPSPRIVHVSTDEVLGEAPPGGVTFGLHVVIVRPANLFGPRQFPEKLIPLATLEAAAGRAIPVYGDGRHARDWLFVDDAARGLALAAGAPAGTTLHLCSGQERTTLEVVSAVCAALDEASPRPDGRPHADGIELVADRPGHDRRYGFGGDRAKSLLGVAPEIPFADGIARTVRWLLESPEWVDRARHDRRRLGRGAPA